MGAGWLGEGKRFQKSRKEESDVKRDIEFKSKGEVCRGWLYTPDEGKAPFAVVVMAGGWCYVKEVVMPHYANFFVKAGLAALLFDYRRFGESDGEPRQHIDPHDQIEDYKNALSFAQTLPEVDPNRVGIWGISYSGGHVLITGATDPRVKCIVSTIPVVDGYETQKQVHGSVQFRRLMEAIMEDRKHRFEDDSKRGYIDTKPSWISRKKRLQTMNIVARLSPRNFCCLIAFFPICAGF
jgi:dipeptidyl aminopeptidase/acylaminoacyl peptidase